MRKILVRDKERIGAWVAARVGMSAEWGGYEALGVEDENGELIAGVVYSGYVKGARCSMHCAGIGKRWLTKKFLWMCFDYPFNQLGIKVIVNPVDADNAESLSFTKHCGFTEKCVIEDGAGDHDLVVFTLRRSDCKWLGVSHV